MYHRFFKRVFDFSSALIALIILSPLMLVTCILLHFANEGAGIFFKHRRCAQHGRFFHVIKFKTMNDKRDADGKLLPDGQRLTKIGKFIRTTSIDELPQLFNVLKGDMSIVGPRPLYDWFLPLYDDEQRRRLDVMQGITGWAQVNGRNSLRYSEKFKYDVWYVDHQSFRLDMLIIAKSIAIVFKRSDIGNGEDDDAIVDDLNFGARHEEMIKQANNGSR